jgi:hypothetical protein
VSGQQLRRDGKLVEARDALLACSRDCPRLIQSECMQWYDELRRQVPSVIIRARMGDQDLVDVTLIVDGRREATRLDGLEVSVNPGPHRFRLERAGASVEEQVLVASGEQRRPLVFTFPSPTPAGTATTASSAPAKPPPPLERPVPATVIVAGGLAVAALGAAAVMGIVGKSEEKGLMDSCAPTCTDAELEPMQSKYRVANAAWVVGGVAAAAGVVLYLTRPAISPPMRNSTAAASPSVGYDFGVSPNGASLSLRGQF